MFCGLAETEIFNLPDTTSDDRVTHESEQDAVQVQLDVTLTDCCEALPPNVRKVSSVESAGVAFACETDMARL